MNWLRAAGILLGATAFLSPAEVPVSTRCLREIGFVHGVWRTNETYRAIFWDAPTFIYLAGLAGKVVEDGRNNVAILPVYDSDPVHFRKQNYIFLSTGLILSARDEETLVEAVRAEMNQPHLRQRRQDVEWVSACAMPLGYKAGNLGEIQARLASQVSKYQAALVPRLKRRP